MFICLCNVCMAPVMLHLREKPYGKGLRTDVESYLEAKSPIYLPWKVGQIKAQRKSFTNKEKLVRVPAQSPSLLDQEASRRLCPLWCSSHQHLERRRRREVIPRWPAGTKTATRGAGKQSGFEGMHRWPALGREEPAGLKGGDAWRTNGCLPVDL
jgi:hypothetical protein